jgi:hypothetical protein
MTSEIKKPKKSHFDGTSSSEDKQVSEEERFGITLEYASLDEMPLEERRKQALKPLYLTRYE